MTSRPSSSRPAPARGSAAASCAPRSTAGRSSATCSMRPARPALDPIVIVVPPDERRFDGLDLARRRRRSSTRRPQEGLSSSRPARARARWRGRRGRRRRRDPAGRPAARPRRRSSRRSSRRRGRAGDAVRRPALRRRRRPEPDPRPPRRSGGSRTSSPGDRGFGPVLAAHPELVARRPRRRRQPGRRHARRPRSPAGAYRDRDVRLDRRRRRRSRRPGPSASAPTASRPTRSARSQTTTSTPPSRPCSSPTRAGPRSLPSTALLALADPTSDLAGHRRRAPGRYALPLALHVARSSRSSRRPRCATRSGPAWRSTASQPADRRRRLAGRARASSATRPPPTSPDRPCRLRHRGASAPSSTPWRRRPGRSASRC